MLDSLHSVPLSPAGSSADAATAAASARAPGPSWQHRGGGLRAWIVDMLRFIVWQRDIRRAAAELDALDVGTLRDVRPH
jgi:hypothetical protein